MKKAFLNVVLAICWFGLGVAALMGMPANYPVLFAIAVFLLSLLNCGFAYQNWQKSNR